MQNIHINLYHCLYWGCQVPKYVNSKSGDFTVTYQPNAIKCLAQFIAEHCGSMFRQTLLPYHIGRWIGDWWKSMGGGMITF